MDYSNLFSSPLTAEAIAGAAQRMRAALGDRPLAVQPDAVVVSPALAAAVEAERRKVERQRARGYRHPGSAGRLYKTLYGAAMSRRRGAGLAAHLAHSVRP
jgi:hypothetical protein